MIENDIQTDHCIDKPTLRTSLYSKTLQDPQGRFYALLYAIIILQFIIIAALVAAVTNEYLSNAFMQSWVQQNAPILQVFLNGDVAVLLLGLFVGIAYVFIRNRYDATKTEEKTMQTLTRTNTADGPVGALFTEPLPETKDSKPAKKKRVGKVESQNPETQDQQ